VLVFDLTDPKSYGRIKNWMDDIKANAGIEVPIIIVGNKSDMVDDRIIEYKVAKGLADLYNITYLEVSAKTGTGVAEAFMALTKQILQKKRKDELADAVEIPLNDDAKGKKTKSKTPSGHNSVNTPGKSSVILDESTTKKKDVVSDV